MRDPKLDVIETFLASSFDRRPQLRHVIDKNRRLPIRPLRSRGFWVKTEQDGDMGCPCPCVCLQVPLEPADPARNLGNPKPFLGRFQPLLDVVSVGLDPRS